VTNDPFAQTIIRCHRTVKPTIVGEIVRQAGVSLEQFLDAL